MKDFKIAIIVHLLLAAYCAYLLCFTSTPPLLIRIILIGALLCVASCMLPISLPDGHFQTVFYGLTTANCALFLFVVHSAVFYKLSIILSLYFPIYNIAVLFNRRTIRKHLNELKSFNLRQYVGQESPREKIKE